MMMMTMMMIMTIRSLSTHA